MIVIVYILFFLHRARALDGAFFETFANVYEKQKGLIKRAKKESKRQAETLIEKQEADANSVFYALFPSESFTHNQVFLFVRPVCLRLPN